MKELRLPIFIVNFAWVAVFAPLPILAPIPIFTSGFIGCRAASAQELWKLPSPISPENSSLSFKVDTTWSSIHGAAKDFHGKIWLRQPSDPLSIATEIRIPVNNLATESKSNDTRLRECMASVEYPEVVLLTNTLSPQCHPKNIVAGSSCTGTLTGTLTIRDVKREVLLPVTIAFDGDSYLISGSFDFDWPDYNIEDPSMVLAKVEPKVTVTYSTSVPSVKTLALKNPSTQKSGLPADRIN